MAPDHRFAVIVMANQTGITLNRSIEKAMELMLPLKPKQGDKEWPRIRDYVPGEGSRQGDSTGGSLSDDGWIAGILYVPIVTDPLRL
jgi:hypothetical protein